MKYTLWIAIFLLVFGSSVSMLSATGSYDVTITGFSNPFDQETTTQLTEAAVSTESNPLGGETLLPILLKTVIGGLLTMITIIPVLSSIGIPIWISAVFQAPIWIIYIVDLVALLKGIIIN